MAADYREQAEQDLLRVLQGRVNELKSVFEASSNHWGFEDPVYRFYHQSFKVYWLQECTREIVKHLQALAPHLKLNSWFMNIVDQGTECLIHEGGSPSHPLGQIPPRLGIGVIVPAEVERRAQHGRQGVDGDDRDAGLGEPAGQQAALPPKVPAVTVAQPWVLLRQIEGPGHAGVGQHLERGLAELLGRGGGRQAVEPAAGVVEMIDKPLPPGETGRVHPRRELQARGRVGRGRTRARRRR